MNRPEMHYSKIIFLIETIQDSIHSNVLCRTFDFRHLLVSQTYPKKIIIKLNMGVCINHELLQRRKYVKKMLDKTEKFAEILKENLASVIEVPMMVRRTSDYELLIDVKGCETLAFSFQQIRDLEEWEYNSTNLVQLAEQKNEQLEKHYKDLRANGYTEFSFYDDELLIAKDFCKTQYGKPVCHRFVAEILRHVASQCFTSYVFDEADYYYTQDISDAEDAQKEVQDILDGLIGKLTK